MVRITERRSTSSIPGDDEHELQTKRNHDRSKRPTREDKGKGIAGTSQQEAPRKSRSSRPNPHIQWPRPDGIPFPGIDIHPVIDKTEFVKEPSYVNKRKTDGWVHYNSVCYNGLLNVEILPTRFLCMNMLEELGIENEVLAVLDRMGLRTMVRKQYPLYPELVRQFLASCEVYYPSNDQGNVEKGNLWYKIQGKSYKISMSELCNIYGFDDSLSRPEFPGNKFFRQSHFLWNLIAKGIATPRAMKLTLIRNPIIRIVAKALSFTMFCKEDPGALRNDELLLLHYGMPEFVHNIYTDPPRAQNTNFGSAFAHFLTERKFRGLEGPGRNEVCGSLLTPIFAFHGIEIDLAETEGVLTPSLFDMRHLINCKWIVDGKWRYTALDGTKLSIQLPSEHAPLTSIDNVKFLPSSSAQTTEPAHSTEPVAPLQRRKRRHVTRDPDTAETSSGPAPPEPRYQLQPYEGQFCPSPLRDTWTTTEYMQHQHRTSSKLHSMLAAIWGAFSCSRGTDAVSGSELARSRMPPHSGPSTDVRHEDASDDADDADDVLHCDETMADDESPHF